MAISPHPVLVSAVAIMTATATVAVPYRPPPDAAPVTSHFVEAAKARSRGYKKTCGTANRTGRDRLECRRLEDSAFLAEAAAESARKLKLRSRDRGRR